MTVPDKIRPLRITDLEKLGDRLGFSLTTAYSEIMVGIIVRMTVRVSKDGTVDALEFLVANLVVKSPFSRSHPSYQFHFSRPKLYEPDPGKETKLVSVIIRTDYGEMVIISKLPDT